MWNGNVELLNAVRERILANAARFNMKYYGVRVSSFVEDMLETPPCNTQNCIAGETLLQIGKATINKDGGLSYADKADDDFEVSSAAANALGINMFEAKRLFHFKSWSHGYADPQGWPEQFEKEYDEAKTV